METANKFSDFTKAAKKAGYSGIYDDVIIITVHGTALIYDFRKNMLGKSRLQPKEVASIEGLVVVGCNPCLKSISIQPTKTDWLHKKWLGPKSFPIKFIISPKMSEEEHDTYRMDDAIMEWELGGYD